ncbi:olee1-like protein [Cornus florida]|uniref:olee1-like protein n=1 Tax=Cornus florida TaxID=4283 RepID=UPI00289C46B3|nr:olee1-like protein [Cornus florida]
MAKSFQAAVTFFAGAVYLLSLLSIALSADPKFHVEGEVYCDNCRTQFVTRISEVILGAKVRLECRDRAGGEIKYRVEGDTNESGVYRLPVEGEHEEEICEVSLVKSGKPDCEEISKDEPTKFSSRISLTSNNGIASEVRKANPLGFMTKERVPECTQVFKELGIFPTDNM